MTKLLDVAVPLYAMTEYVEICGSSLYSDKNMLGFLCTKIEHPPKCSSLYIVGEHARSCSSLYIVMEYVGSCIPPMHCDETRWKL